MRKRKPSVGLVPHVEGGYGLAYCPQCGEAVSNFFKVGEMVSVQVTGERPYYGKLLNIINDENTPTAVVAKSHSEITKVRLDSIRKVD